jgi:hypothetical protein
MVRPGLVGLALSPSTHGQRLRHNYHHNFLSPWRLSYTHLVAVMFKIWKQAWRRGVGETNSTPRHDSDQMAQLSRTGNEGTYLPSIDVAPSTVDDASGAVLSAAGRKRALSQQSSSSESSSPPKRPKAIHDDSPSFRTMDISALLRSWFSTNPPQNSPSHLCTSISVGWMRKRNTCHNA